MWGSAALCAGRRRKRMKPVPLHTGQQPMLNPQIQNATIPVIHITQLSCVLRVREVREAGAPNLVQGLTATGMLPLWNVFNTLAVALKEYILFTDSCSLRRIMLAPIRFLGTKAARMLHAESSQGSPLWVSALLARRAVLLQHKPQALLSMRTMPRQGMQGCPICIPL